MWKGYEVKGRTRGSRESLLPSAEKCRSRFLQPMTTARPPSSQLNLTGSSDLVQRRLNQSEPQSDLGGVAHLLTSCAGRYVLWDKMRNGSAIRDNDDDAAEGRMDVRNDRVVPQRTAEAEKQEQERAVDPTAAANGETVTATPGSDDQPAKKVRLSGAQKKHLARQKKEEQWQAKQAAKAADKEERAEGGETGGGRQSGKGQNKVRMLVERGRLPQALTLTLSSRAESSIIALANNPSSFVLTRAKANNASAARPANGLTISLASSKSVPTTSNLDCRLRLMTSRPS